MVEMLIRKQLVLAGSLCSYHARKTRPPAFCVRVLLLVQFFDVTLTKLLAVIFGISLLYYTL